MDRRRHAQEQQLAGTISYLPKKQLDSSIFVEKHLLKTIILGGFLLLLKENRV